MEAKKHIIYTENELERLFKYSLEVPSPFIFVDAETNSQYERKAKLWGFSICFNDQRAFYIPWRDKEGNMIWTKEQQDKISGWLLSICKVKKLINHNIIYDVLVFEYNLGIELTDYIYSDTILLKHTIDEEPPFALKELAVLELGPGANKAQETLKENVLANGGSWKKDQKDMYKADTEILGDYAMDDVLLTYKLFKIFDKRLRDQNLEKLFYEEEIMPLYKECTIPMKRAGFYVDVEYFKQLAVELEELISNTEHEIFKQIENDVQPFIKELLDKDFPVKNSGNFPKALADFAGIPLPMRKTKDKDTKEEVLKVTLAAKAILAQKEQNPEHSNFYDWVLGNAELSIDPMAIDMAQRQLFFSADKNSENRFIFNLGSNDHLAYYFFKVKGYAPLSKTHKGKAQVNATFIESVQLKHNDEIASKLIEMKKLGKLLSTYVRGILDKQIDGMIFASFLQFGTTSGRFSCTSPNLQNLPRIKDEESGMSELVLKYVNAIKKGFVAGEGYKLVNADYSQLEPVCFAHMSGSESLRDVFRQGKDLYSQVAIDVNKLGHLFSASKKADNYLKKHKPELRQLWKIPTLGIVYGMEEARLVQSIAGLDYKEARKIIDNYLSTYPDLKKYMYSCNGSAKKFGYVKTEFGRIRHLPEAKQLFDKYGNDLLDFRWARANNLQAERRLFKNCLNNAKNFPIQGLAAHIVNRAAIQVNRRFKAEGIDGCIVANIHDELTCRVRADQAEKAAEILQDCMENTTKISIPLSAVPLIGYSWDEAK